jgi:hypothetical protein
MTCRRPLWVQCLLPFTSRGWVGPHSPSSAFVTSPLSATFCMPRMPTSRSARTERRSPSTVPTTRSIPSRSRSTGTGPESRLEGVGVDKAFYVSMPSAGGCSCPTPIRPTRASASSIMERRATFSFLTSMARSRRPGCRGTSRRRCPPCATAEACTVALRDIRRLLRRAPRRLSRCAVRRQSARWFAVARGRGARTVASGVSSLPPRRITRGTRNVANTGHALGTRRCESWPSPKCRITFAVGLGA